MGIYLKLRNGKWMLIKGRLSQVVVSRGKKSLRYIFTGETIEGEPRPRQQLTKGLTVPSTKVNRVMHHLLEALESRKADYDILIYPLSPEEYAIRYPDDVSPIIKEALRSLQEGSRRKAAGSQGSGLSEKSSS